MYYESDLLEFIYKYFSSQKCYVTIKSVNGCPTHCMYMYTCTHYTVGLGTNGISGSGEEGMGIWHESYCQRQRHDCTTTSSKRYEDEVEMKTDTPTLVIYPVTISYFKDSHRYSSHSLIPPYLSHNCLTLVLESKTFSSDSNFVPVFNNKKCSSAVIVQEILLEAGHVTYQTFITQRERDL